MIPITFTIIGTILLFFIIHFFYTQIIYSTNRFIALAFFSVSIIALALVLSKSVDKFAALSFSLIFLFYTILLWGTKKFYKNLNNFLIGKSFIDSKFKDKEFTYILWDGDLPGSGTWWDEKLASAPSRLDTTLTILLLILPILLSSLVNFLFQA
ncbi:MAG TPA: hypothetical protein VK173_01730 [Lacibacter sp.]|nr:hypothetical protein [Lacibacter sp.]